MKVLFVNHTSSVSGGERSLLTAVDALREQLEICAACPPGPLADEFAARGIEVRPITSTAGSLRLHPLHTPRALYELARAGLEVRGQAAAVGADVVHANSIRAGIACAALSSPPALVHVRDCLPPGPATTATMRLISRRADAIVANSSYTARSVSAAAPAAHPQVIFNPVDLARFDPALFDRGRERAALGYSGDAPFLIALVAQLTPWKGQLTMIEALSILRREGVDCELLLAGAAVFTSSATRYDNVAYELELRRRAEALGLTDKVRFLGEVADVPALLSAVDALALPSREEPFGRALIEAMAMGLPLMATNVGGPPEFVREGIDGFLLDPAQPEAWASAAARLAREPALWARMAAEGRPRALEMFSPQRHAASLMDVYRRIAA